MATASPGDDELIGLIDNFLCDQNGEWDDKGEALLRRAATRLRSLADEKAATEGQRNKWCKAYEAAANDNHTLRTRIDELEKEREDEWHRAEENEHWRKVGEARIAEDDGIIKRQWESITDLSARIATLEEALRQIQDIDAIEAQISAAIRETREEDAKIAEGSSADWLPSGELAEAAIGHGRKLARLIRARASEDGK
jgi:chromosome segregation ATPase